MSAADREVFRKYAVECVDLARVTADPDTKRLLLIRAQEWLKLAYSGHDAKFEQLLTDFNSEQLAGPTQRQPMQQQQSKQEPE
jgi:hypothetical protein